MKIAALVFRVSGEVGPLGTSGVQVLCACGCSPLAFRLAFAPLKRYLIANNKSIELLED